MGGVARNLATALQYLGHNPQFLTALARDNLAKLALNQFKAAGFSFLDDDTDCSNSNLERQQLKVSWYSAGQKEESPSSCFALVLMDSIRGQCEYVVANLEATKAISPQTVDADTIRGAPLLVMDANLRSDTMESLIRVAHHERVPIFIEPTDVLALPRLVNSIKRLRGSEGLVERCSAKPSILCMSPNLFELQRMMELFVDGDEPHSINNDARHELGKTDGGISLDIVERLAKDFMLNCMPELTCLLITLDKRGVMVALRNDYDKNILDMSEPRLIETYREQKLTASTANIETKHFEPLEMVERPVSASGAGDSFAAGFISGLVDNRKLSECIEKGFRASLLALQARDTIPASLRSLTRQF